ncbi:hypothetical protein [Pseudomonas sp. CGJS7]|uniref:hypothetical protein n=1 Tax=Pseudomonas sp. CGJS7 TaxID=3109348 RepID=UPI00300B5BD3
MPVSKFRITARQLEPRVHEAAKDSFNVTIVPAPMKRSMAGMTTYLQIIECLRKGTIVGKPVFREDGFWEFRMERFSANQWHAFRVYASVEGARVVELIVDIKQHLEDRGI